MARKRYILDFVINSSPAEAGARRVIRQLENAEIAARRAGSAMVSAYARAGNAATTAAAKMAQATARMGQGAGGAAGGGTGGRAASTGQTQSIEDRYFKRDYDRRIAYEARKQQAAAASAAVSSRQAQTESDRLQAIQDRHVQRDYSRQVAHERRLIGQKDREKQQLSKIEDRYLRDEYRKRVAFQAKQIKDQEAEAEAVATGRERMLTRSLVAATAVAAAGLSFMTEAYAKIAEDAERAAEATLTLRRNLRVEAALKGAAGPDNQRLAEALKFRVETGLGEAEASDFTRQYLGTVPIARQKKNITPEVEAELMVEAGKMAARQGGDAGTRAELAGILGQFAPVKSTEGALAKLEAIRIALVEGRGDDTPLTRQLLKTAGVMVREGGAVGSLEEQAALVGVTSLSAGPEEAGTRAEQLNRFLRAGLTRMRGGKGTKEPQAVWMKRLGVKESDSLEQALDKIIPDLRAATAAGRAPETYLSEHGVKSDQERRVLIEVEGVYEQLKERFAAARKAGGAGAEMMEANRQFMESDLGRANVGEQLGAVAQTTRGLRGARLLALKKEVAPSPEFQAGEQSIAQQAADKFWGMMTGNLTVPILGLQLGHGDAGKAGMEQRLEMSAISLAQERARKAGVTPEEMTKARHGAYRAGEEHPAEYVNLLEAATLRHGGKVGVDPAAAMTALTAALERNTKIVEDNNKRMGPPPPVAGKVPMALPAAP